MDNKLNAINSKSGSEKGQKPTLAGDFYQALKFSAIQEPLDGITQIIDKVTKSKLYNETQFVKAPKMQKFGSTAWVAQNLGSGLGILAPLIATQKLFVEPAMSGILDDSVIGQKTVLNDLSLKNSLATGFVYGSALTPNQNDGKTFWAQRFDHGVESSFAFGVMTLSSQGLSEFAQSNMSKSLGIDSMLKSSLLNGTLSGAASASITSEIASLIDKHKLANLSDIKQNIASMAILGGLMGGLSDIKNIPRPSENNLKLENIAHTSLAPGVDDVSLHELSAKIAAKFNVNDVNAEKLDALASNYTGSDREMAKAILDKSKINMSDKLLMKNLASAGQNLIAELKLQPNSHVDYFYTLTPDSPGNALAYLTRKANNLEMGIHSLDYLQNDLVSKKSANIVLFDNLENASDKDLALLKNMSKLGHKVYIIDTNNFAKGLNFIDLIDSKKSADKLNNLVLAAKNNALANVADPADILLNSTNNKLANDIGAKIIRPNVDLTHENTPLTADKVYNYLKATYPVKSEANVAADLLANTAQYNDLQTMTKQLVALHDAVIQDLGESLAKDAHLRNLSTDEIRQLGQKNENNLIYVVGVDGGDIGRRAGSSGSFISHIYRAANDLPSDQFVSEKQLKEMYSQGLLGDKHIVYLDDTAYEGVQISKRLSYDLNNYPNVTVALLGSYDSFVKEMLDRQIETNNSRHLVNLTTHFPLKPYSIDSYIKNLRNLNDSQSTRFLDVNQEINRASQVSSFLRKYDGGETYSISSYQVWPYFTADNATYAVRDFSKKVLGIENARNQGKRL